MNLSCLLCGSHGPQVRPRMVEWAEPIGNRRWEVIPACHDSRECRQRVEQLGEVWPLVLVSNDRPVTNDREGAA